MIAFHKFRVSSLRLLGTSQIRSGGGAGGVHSVGSRPSVSPGRTRRLNQPRWRVQIRRPDRLHLSRYSVGEVALGRVCGVHVPHRRPSVPRLLWRLSPISISAASLKPSCIMHHFWLRGGGVVVVVVGLANSSRPSPQRVDYRRPALARTAAV